MQTTKTPPARILVVDDHAIVRHGMGVLLAGAGDLSICGEAATYEDALQAARSLKPDAMVIDLILQDRSGLDLIRALRAEGITIPLLVLSMHDEATHAEKALRAGAQGYVMKEDADEVLVDALRAILSGGLYISDQVNLRLLRTYVDREAGTEENGVSTLTRREQEIFECVGRGMTTRKIAEKFGISARTVEVHRARVKKKLGCEDTAQFLREAVRWVESHSV